MIPRYQRILFWTLAGCILLMTLFLLRGCEQAHRRLTASTAETTPIAAPSSSATEDVTLYAASDSDGSITAVGRSMALPTEPTLRARALLRALIAGYALPDSTHPLPGGPAVDDVFFVNLPAGDAFQSGPDNAQLAVVNLHGAFAAAHPAGIAVEDLTLQSIAGTLHGGFPQLTQVRFLVDGQPRETLAGHADLSRSYPAVDTTYKPANGEAHP